MGVEILARYKNDKGETIAYIARINGNIDRISIEVLKDLCGNHVDNASLINGEYRANKGCHIKTILDPEYVHTKVKQPKEARDRFPDNYYGKEYINICREIRKHANVGNIIVDLNKHIVPDEGSANIVDAIRLSGMQVDLFVYNYLYNIQPYRIQSFTSTKNNKSWFVDMEYSSCMLIELDKKNKDHPFKVSFHEKEAVKECLGEMKIRKKDFYDKPCALIVADCDRIYDTYSVTAYMQIGFILYNLRLKANLCNKDIALIDYESIESEINKIIDNQFNEAAIKYAKSIKMTKFNKVSGIVPFSGRGNSIVSQLMIILDLYSAYDDPDYMKVLLEVAINIISKIDKNQKKEVLNTLIQKYGAYTKNRITQIIYKELK